MIKDLTTTKKINEINQNVKLIFNPSNESYRVFADKERIYQVFSNLIRNAVKFTTGDQAKIEIILEKVKDNKENEWISIKIRDNGTGIDPEILQDYFQNLQQNQNLEVLALVYTFQNRL